MLFGLLREKSKTQINFKKHLEKIKENDTQPAAGVENWRTFFAKVFVKSIFIKMLSLDTKIYRI